MMELFIVKKNKAILIIFLLSIFNPVAFGLYNPDTPDYIATFLKEADAYEKKSSDTKTYLVYRKWLDNKLNETYQILMKYLDKKNRKALRESQRRWISFRDAEVDFITSNWVRNSFGSSYELSREGYIITILHDRVLHLLNYLKNYPYDPRKNKAHKGKVVQKKK